MRVLTALLSMVLFTYLSFDIISAQTFDLQNAPGTTGELGIRFLHPNMQSETKFSTFSGVYELSFNTPVSNKLNLIGVFPYISTKMDLEIYFMDYSHDISFSEKGFGNIYVGLQTKPQNTEGNNSFLTFGLSLPTADEDAASFGMESDFLKLRKYLPDVLAINFLYSYQVMNQNGLRFGLEAGPDIFTTTGDNEQDTEVYLRYGFFTAIQAGKLLFNAEIAGLAIISEDVDDFGDRFVHTFDFGAFLMLNKIRPYAFYKIYLRDEISDEVNGVLGVGISFSFNK